MYISICVYMECCILGEKETWRTGCESVAQKLCALEASGLEYVYLSVLEVPQLENGE